MYDGVPKDFLEYVKGLERRIDEQSRLKLTSVVIPEGGVTVKGGGGIWAEDSAGVRTFFIGGLRDQWTRPDGTPQSVAVISDDSGHWRIAVWDDEPLSGGYSQEVRIWDAFGNMVFQTDSSGGLERPALAIPMYCRYVPPAEPTFTYTNIPVANLASAQTVWEGRIFQVLCSYVEISGIWGSATGSNTTTYTVQAGGQTVGSWVSTGIENATRMFDIRSWRGFEGVSVRLLASSTGTGNAACQINGCVQRGSV